MGILYVVATPIGNLSDISQRALDVLKSVDIIACEDTRTSSVLLKAFNINQKLISYHKFNELNRSDELIQDMQNGKNIALISDAGCPCISDPGNILVHKAVMNNIEVVSIPGASAVTAALMVSGMDTSSFTFYGFLNRSKVGEDLEKIKKDTSHIAIIYESPKRIMKTLEKISAIFDNPYVCVCNDLTKKFEKKYYGDTLSVLNQLENNARHELGEYVILIEKKVQDNDIKDDNLCLEALLVNEIIQNDLSLRDAIKMVSEKYHYPKNMVYNASLNLKKLSFVEKR